MSGAAPATISAPDRINIASYLARAAARRPDAVAIAAARSGRRWSRLTFRELDERSNRLARGLAQEGVAAGDRVLVMVRAGVDLITLTYSLFKAGAVPVLIDPGMGIRGFLRCVEQTRPQTLIGIPLAHVLHRVFPGPFRSVRRNVTVGRRLFWGGSTLAALETGVSSAPIMAHTAKEDTAAVLFTSGSTGPAKGAVYSHGNFDAQVRALSADYGFEPGEVDLAAFPLFSLFDNALEMTSVIPKLDPSRPGRCDPAEIVSAIEENACTSAFGSPAIWRRVAPWCADRGRKLSSLRRILIAGASVPPSLIEQLHGLLPPEGDVFTPYGATEALPVARASGREVVAETAAATREGAGTCVGRPASGIEIAVIRIDDGPIRRWSGDLRVADGEVGELCVKGPVVTRSYLNRPDADALAKIREGEAVWHRMGDLGYRDEAGRIWFAGRKVERVETSAGPLFTDRVEGVFAAHPSVHRCALVGVGEPGRARPVLVVEGREDAALARQLRERGLVDAILFHPRFPVDVRHNAKIHRHALRDWAAKRLAAS